MKNRKVKKRKQKFAWTDFLKSWLTAFGPVLLLVMIGCTVGTYAMCENDLLEADVNYNNRAVQLENEVSFFSGENAPKTEQEWNRALFYHKLDMMVPGIHAVLLDEDRNLVFDSSNTLLMLDMGENGGALRDTEPSYYECVDKETLKKFKEVTAPYSYNVSVVLQDAYVKDDHFVPGVMEIYDQMEIEEDVYVGGESLKETVDLTPADVSGYEHLTGLNKKNQGLYRASVYLPVALDKLFDPYNSITDDMVKWCRDMSEEAWQEAGGRYEDTKYMHTTQYQFCRFASNHENYIMVTGLQYDAFMNNRSTIVFVYAFGVLISAFLALVEAVGFYRIYRREREMTKMQVQFTNTLAHDLKTPLMAISGYAETLHDMVKEGTQKEYIGAIQNNVAYMNKMTEDILTMAKIRSFKEIEKKDTDLAAIIKQVLICYKDTLKERNIMLEVNGSCHVRANALLMEQALWNVIDNAVKYTPEGKRISIVLKEHSVTVENEGIQIDENILKTAWEPFSKGNEARTREGGVGLGLSIVKEIMELHGFTGSIENTENGVCVELAFL